MGSLTSTPSVERLIYLIRGNRVMLDTDLARVYGVTTFNLNKAVKRNLVRFPADFMFQLSPQEAESLTFQIGISKHKGRGGRRSRPYAFTEQGVAMLSSVLRSPQAALVNIAVMRAFMKLRETLSLHKELAAKLQELERRIAGHDADIKSVFAAIRGLMAPPVSAKKRIGFQP